MAIHGDNQSSEECCDCSKLNKVVKYFTIEDLNDMIAPIIRQEFPELKGSGLSMQLECETIDDELVGMQVRIVE